MDSQKLDIRLSLTQTQLRLLKTAIFDLIVDTENEEHSIYQDNKIGVIDDDELDISVKRISYKLDILYDIDEQIADNMEAYDVDL